MALLEKWDFALWGNLTLIKMDTAIYPFFCIRPVSNFHISRNNYDDDVGLHVLGCQVDIGTNCNK